jgi:hypothetical protein
VQLRGPEPVENVATTASTPMLTDTQVRDQLREAVARLDRAESCGTPDDLIDALLPVSRCYLSIGAHNAAEDTLRQALRTARRCGSNQKLAGVLTELAQVASLHALDLKDHDPSAARVSRDRARDSAFEASALIHKHAQAAWATPALMAVSDVLMLCGDQDDAAAMRLRAQSWQGQC